MPKFQFHKNVRGTVKFICQFDDKGINSNCDVAIKGSFTDLEFDMLKCILIAKFSEHVQEQLDKGYNESLKKQSNNN